VHNTGTICRTAEGDAFLPNIPFPKLELIKMLDTTTTVNDAFNVSRITGLPDIYT
jgi:hypothetical protein